MNRRVVVSSLIAASFCVLFCSGMTAAGKVQAVSFSLEERSETVGDFGDSVGKTDSDVAINEENFPDSGFRKVVETFDSDGNGILSESEISKIQTIECKKSGITSLKGIENLTNLSTLRCADNPITEVDFSRNLKLNELDISDTPITSLDLSANTDLIILSCDRTNLTTLDLRKNKGLGYLSCQETTLKKVDVRDLAYLSYINVFGEFDRSTWSACGRIEVLNLSGCTQLETVICANNKIRILDLSATNCLTELNCEFNELQSLKLGKKSALKSLFCRYNQLTSLDVSNAGRLTELYCSDNQLTKLDVSNDAKLHQLVTQGNQLASLDIRTCTDLFSAFDTKYISLYTYSEYPYLTFSRYMDEMDILLGIDFDIDTKLTGVEMPEIVTIDYIHFPDYYFRNYVATTLDSDSNGILFGEELDDVTYIDCSRMGIESMQGVEFFPNLTTLDCSKNQIRNLKLTNPKLTMLYCSGDLNIYDMPIGVLETLDVSALKDLDYLACSNNQIKTLDLSHNTKLTYLLCTSNPLTDLDLSKLSKLELINIADTKISQIDTTKMPQLRSLDISMTSVTSLDVSKNPELFFLVCSYCEIPELDVSHNPDLYELDCRGVPLKALDVTHNPDLVELCVSGGEIKNLDVTKNPELRVLDVSWNKMRYLDTSKCPDLSELVVSYSQLSELDASHNPNLKILECYSMENMERLDVSHNPELVKLKCATNTFRSLDLRNCKKLTYLDCSENQLYDLDVSENTLLETLYCGTNPFTKLDLSKLSNLKHFMCDNCKDLKSLDLSHNPELLRLWCNSVPLGKLDVSHNPKLYVIMCQYAHLTSLDVSACTGLEYLDCSHNFLKEPPEVPDGASLIFAPQIDQAVFANLRVVDAKEDSLRLTWDIVEGSAQGVEIWISSSENGTFRFKTYNDVVKGLNPDTEYFFKVRGFVREQRTIYYGEFSDVVRGKTKASSGKEPTPTVTTKPTGKVTPGPTGKVTVTPTKKVTVTPTKKVTPTEKVTPTPVKDPTFEDFVERLYVVALGRASEPEGKAFWVKQVVEEGKTGADCARFFLLDADEFMKRNLSVEDFVETLYKTFFDREADDAGKKGWVEAIKSGKKTRAEVVNDFIESTEWCDVCATYGVKSGAKWHKATRASKNAIDFATRLYTCCLKRDPDEAGVKYWSLALTNLEKTGAEAAKSFFESDEFIGFKTTDKDYLIRLYKTFMGREPVTSEVDYWLGEMAAGRQTRSSILSFFAQSEEFTGICKKYGIDRGTI